jgi:HD-like signal output (HDOD) protein
MVGALRQPGHKTMTTDILCEPQAAVIDTVKKVSSIATLPEVTARIVATVEDPNSSAAQLNRIVSHDPALVTRILKVVNSAFYGLPGQIASVERAIVLLGINAVKNLAVAASLGKLFKGVQLGGGFAARDLWTHCISVGVAARDLARQMRVPLVDEAFLAGMIHDVGLLVSLQVFPDKLVEACDRARDENTHFCDIERQMIQMDHQQLGQALCEQWKFPRSCQLVAGYHHRPTQLSDGNRLLVTIVYAADTLCCAAGQGFNLTALRQQMHEGGLSGVGLEQAMLDQTVARLPQLVEECSSILG